MAASIMLDPARPLPIHIGCAGMGAFSLYGLFQVILASDSFRDFPVPLAMFLPLIGLGLVFSALVWIGKSWSRWFLIAWALFPIMGLYLAESDLHIVVSWFFLFQVFFVAILFAPVSNRWLKEIRSAAS
jgi:hypothetical protein